MRTIFTAMAALALAACGSEDAEPSAQGTTAPAANDNAVARAESGLEVIPVTVTTEEGSHTFQTEIAATRQEQSRGMMFRTEMGEDEAMIFPYEVADMRSFWMKNTFIPLDIIFIAEDGTIINIADGVPYNENSVASEAPAIAVLELSGGRAEELGIGPGDRVEW